MKKILLTIATVAVAAVSAQAQVIDVLPGKSLIFTSIATAAGWGDVTYQWYRDGQPIPGATDTVYNLPSTLAYGVSVEFKRGAVSSACPSEIMYSNIFLVTFCAMKVGALCWASENVDDFRAFATRPDMYTDFYQWNKPIAYSATDPVTPDWDAAASTSATWIISPCPTGWRLPTQAEFQALSSSSSPAGGTWAAANARGNLVAGRFYGPNHASCTLPNSMSGCIFLPVVGRRDYSDGTLYLQGSNGYYWSATEYNSTIGYNQYFHSTNNYPNNGLEKAYGMSVRCVQ